MTTPPLLPSRSLFAFAKKFTPIMPYPFLIFEPMVRSEERRASGHVARSVDLGYYPIGEVKKVGGGRSRTGTYFWDGRPIIHSDFQRPYLGKRV